MVCEITLPRAVTCGLPTKKHTKKRETLRNANQNKTTRRGAGYEKVYEPPSPTRKHSELKEPYEMLNKTKTLTTIATQKKAKEKALN